MDKKCRKFQDWLEGKDFNIAAPKSKVRKAK